MQISCSVVHPTSSTQRKCIINQLMLQESRLYREKLYIHMADAPKIYSAVVVFMQSKVVTSVRHYV
jgi:hypothetical protein